MKNHILLFLLLAALASSCVSKKEFLAMQGNRDQVLQDLERMRGQLNDCERQTADLRGEISRLNTELSVRNAELQNERNRAATLESQVEYLKNTNTDLLARLSDLSVISQTGAESIKKSLEALNEQNKYIKDLTGTIQRKDSMNLALVMNLKRSLSDVNDEDVTIEVKKGVVYISLSDKMLFRSGSYEILPRAETVLGKIAKVVNDHRELDLLVEGHTDNVPINTSCLKDNWDLSVMRATSVVRSLQRKYNVDPARMTAGGRSEFIPKANNTTTDGRSLNRRTEIIILPKLDQFFQLLEPPTAGK